MSKVKNSVKKLLGFIRVNFFGVTAGNGVYIGKNCSLKGKEHINLGDFVIVRPYAQIWSGGVVRIGQGSEIGERCRISITNSLEIGKKVLLSPNVYITDCDHAYEEVEVPIMDQGTVQENNNVVIGDDSFIGINAVIIGKVNIGQHCVIGANSVVTKNIPDYCVAAGCPAKVVKRYDLEGTIWRRMIE